MNKPPVEQMREALDYAADCANEELRQAKNLYSHYPEDGLGRKIKAAQAQVDCIASALSALSAPAATEAPSEQPAAQERAEPQTVPDKEGLRDALIAAREALRHPNDEWKGVVERQALDKIAKVLYE